MMKTVVKSEKPSTDQSKPTEARPKSNLKAALGKYKAVIIQKEGCWDEDLKKTIPD